MSVSGRLSDFGAQRPPWNMTGRSGALGAIDSWKPLVVCSTGPSTQGLLACLRAGGRCTRQGGLGGGRATHLFVGHAHALQRLLAGARAGAGHVKHAHHRRALRAAEPAGLPAHVQRVFVCYVCVWRGGSLSAWLVGVACGQLGGCGCLGGTDPLATLPTVYHCSAAECLWRGWAAASRRHSRQGKHSGAWRTLALRRGQLLPAHCCWQRHAQLLHAGVLAAPPGTSCVVLNCPVPVRSLRALLHFCTHLPMMTSATMRPCRLAGPASGMREGCPVTQSCVGGQGRQSERRVHSHFLLVCASTAGMQLRSTQPSAERQQVQEVRRLDSLPPLDLGAQPTRRTRPVPAPRVY